MSEGNSALAVYALTHAGAVRPRNEDTVAVGDWIAVNDLRRPKPFRFDLSRPVVAVVADGMGGHAAGDVASCSVAAHIIGRGEQVADRDQAKDVVQEANRELYASMQRGEGAPGMGTTLAGLVLRRDSVVVFNVGDSRAYRWRQKQLVQLSTDDTPGPKLDNGRTAANTTPIVTQSLGGHMHFEPVEAHVEVEAPAPGTCYLLCSDGLTDLVDSGRIAARLQEAEDVDEKSAETDARRHGDGSCSYAGAVQSLFEDAMAAGGKDNISIVLLRLGRSF